MYDNTPFKNNQAARADRRVRETSGNTTTTTTTGRDGSIKKVKQTSVTDDGFKHKSVSKYNDGSISSTKTSHRGEVGSVKQKSSKLEKFNGDDRTYVKTVDRVGRSSQKSIESGKISKQTTKEPGLKAKSVTKYDAYGPKMEKESHRGTYDGKKQMSSRKVKYNEEGERTSMKQVNKVGKSVDKDKAKFSTDKNTGKRTASITSVRKNETRKELGLKSRTKTKKILD